MRLEKLTRENVQAIPCRSGIYFFFDEQGQAIYVGKAVQLRARLRDHLDGHGYLEYVRETGQRLLLDLQVIDYALDEVKYFTVRFCGEYETDREEVKYMNLLQPCLNYDTFKPQYRAVQERMRIDRRPADMEVWKRVVGQLSC